jgi:hypothetical protein
MGRFSVVNTRAWEKVPAAKQFLLHAFMKCNNDSLRKEQLNAYVFYSFAEVKAVS